MTEDNAVTPEIARAHMAADRVAGDLIDRIMERVERLKGAYRDLDEAAQETFQSALQEGVEAAIREACQVIAANNPRVLPGKVKTVTLAGSELAKVVVNVPLNPDGWALHTAAGLADAQVVVVGLDYDDYLAGLEDFPIYDDQYGMDLGGTPATDAIELVEVLMEGALLGHLPLAGEHEAGVAVEFEGLDSEKGTLEYDVALGNPEDNTSDRGILHFKGDPVALEALPLFQRVEASDTPGARLVIVGPDGPVGSVVLTGKYRKGDAVYLHAGEDRLSAVYDTKKGKPDQILYDGPLAALDAVTGFEKL